VHSSAEIRNALLQINKDFNRGLGGRLDPNHLYALGGRLVLEYGPDLFPRLCWVVDQRFGFVIGRS
jgi:hypothetical protein